MRFTKRRKGNGHFLGINGVRTNNPLKCRPADSAQHHDLHHRCFPGGGKSSLILEALFKAVNKELNGSREPKEVYDQLSGLEKHRQGHRHRSVAVGRTLLVQPGNLRGLFTYIRDWFCRVAGASTRIRRAFFVQCRRRRLKRSLQRRRCYQIRNAFFCPTFTLPAMSVKANVLTAKRWRSNIKENQLPTCWI